MSMAPIREKGIYELYYISIVLKGLNALLEFALGVTLLITSRFSDVLLALMQTELVEDPGDFLARHANQISPYLSTRFELFAGMYLIVHGVVKGIIIWGLLRKQLWAYPAGLAVFALFIAYQMMKWFQHHSIPLLLFTIFDLFVMALIYHEYRRARLGEL